LACRCETPGFSRPKAFTQRLRRSFSMSVGLPTIICGCIMMGTKIFGEWPKLHTVKALLRDADDGHLVIVDGQFLAENFRISGEARLPIVVIQHEVGMSAGRRSSSV